MYNCIFGWPVLLDIFKNDSANYPFFGPGIPTAVFLQMPCSLAHLGIYLITDFQAISLEILTQQVSSVALLNNNDIGQLRNTLGQRVVQNVRIYCYIRIKECIF